MKELPDIAVETDEGTLAHVEWWSSEVVAATGARNEWIRDARNEGFSLRAIAEAANMSVEAVRRIANRTP